uniref:Uncharacterized protein n=1 Tax=Ciona savignyi TaxID=51511 RepID=H2ZJS3_CIOSA
MREYEASYHGGVNHHHHHGRLSSSEMNLYEKRDYRSHQRRRISHAELESSSGRKHHHSKLKRPDKFKRRNPSLSSTDEEREDFHSTPDYSSCDDNNYYGRAWSRDDLLYFSSPWRGDLSMTSPQFDGRLRKKVHFTESVEQKFRSKHQSFSDQ